MPIDYNKYGKEFVQISKRLRSFGYCAYCGNQNGKPNFRTGSKVVLTVHHLDKDIANNAPDNLVPLCQQCHHSANHDRTPWWNEDCYVSFEKWRDENAK